MRGWGIALGVLFLLWGVSPASAATVYFGLVNGESYYNMEGFPVTVEQTPGNMENALQATGVDGVLILSPGTYPAAVLDDGDGLDTTATGQTIRAYASEDNGAGGYTGGVIIDGSSFSADHLLRIAHAGCSIKGIELVGNTFDTTHYVLWVNSSSFEAKRLIVRDGGKGIFHRNGADFNSCHFTGTYTTTLGWPQGDGTFNYCVFDYAGGPLAPNADTVVTTFNNCNFTGAGGPIYRNTRPGTKAYFNNCLIARYSFGFIIDNRYAGAATATNCLLLPKAFDADFGTIFNDPDGPSYRYLEDGGGNFSADPKWNSARRPGIIVPWFVIVAADAYLDRAKIAADYAMQQYGWNVSIAPTKLDDWVSTLSWSKLSVLAADGHDVGSYSYNHSYLTNMDGFLIRYEGPAATLTILNDVLSIEVEGVDDVGPIDLIASEFDTLGELTTYLDGLGNFVCTMKTDVVGYRNTSAASSTLADVAGQDITTKFHCPRDHTRTFDREMLGSKARIEAETGGVVRGFVYPYLADSDITEQALLDAGYKAALIGQNGDLGMDAISPLRMYSLGNAGIDWENINAYAAGLAGYLSHVGGVTVLWTCGSQMEPDAAKWKALFDALSECPHIRVMSAAEAAEHINGERTGLLPPVTAFSGIYTFERDDWSDGTDHTPCADSPAVNAGAVLPGLHDNPVPAVDYNGVVVNTVPDIGAFECTSCDLDGDGLTDVEEIALGTDPADADSDDDGLTDGDEVAIHQTNPTVRDTDNDGYNDKDEVDAGSDPNDPGSIPPPDVLVTFTYVNRFGRSPSRAPGQMYYPSGVAVDSSTGDVFIMDTSNQRLQRFDQDGNYITMWSTGPDYGIAVHSATHAVYVCYGVSDEIRKFDPDGNLLLSWGSQGGGPGQFLNPRDVAVNPQNGNIFVLDEGNLRVQEFTADGVFVSEWPSHTSATVKGISVSPNGNYVYVADTNAALIHKFSINGQLLASWGGEGTELGQLRWPRDVCAGGDGYVYVADSDNDRLQKFDSDGTPLGEIKGPHNEEMGTFHPRSVAVNLATGEFYATPAYAHRVDRFGSDDSYLYSWGDHEEEGEVLNDVRGITIDGDAGVLYVTDSMVHRVKKFSLDGIFISEFVQITRDGKNYPTYPVPIDLDPEGDLWILDRGIYYSDEYEFVREFGQDYLYKSGFRYIGMEAGMNGLALVPSSGDLFVSNTNFNKFYKFTSTGELLFEKNIVGGGPGQIKTPGGVAVDEGRGCFYLVDSGNERIQKFDLDGAYLGEWGNSGSAPGQFNLSSYSQVTTDEHGNVWVMDSGNARIQVFSAHGDYMGQIGAYGWGVGRFAWPVGVAVYQKRVYITDTGGDEVEVYEFTIDYGTSDLDRDGMADAWEAEKGLILNFDDAQDDPDNDGLTNSEEEDLGTDPMNDDTDGDGYTDHEEIQAGTDPLLVSSFPDDL
jgi:DNA-binding beta-propeller fold protein YncE/peptidoglycan/xylan/chitin deacetylase (PgdA/CDA1 family)